MNKQNEEVIFPGDDLDKQIKDLQKQKKDLKKDKEKKKGKDDKWWTKFFGKNKLKKPKVVAVIYLRNNGNAELLELEPKNEMFSIHGKTYHERSDCIYTVTKDRIPLAIIQEWSLIPVGTKRWDEQDMVEKFSQLEEHVLKGIRNAELVRRDGEERKPVSTKQMILYVILAVVAGAIMINYI